MNGGRDDLRDELDALLDRALQSYTPGAPRPGLEGRIWARVAGVGEISRRARLEMRWVWAAAAGLAAFAVLLTVLLRTDTPVAAPDVAGIPEHRPAVRGMGPDGPHSAASPQPARPAAARRVQSARLAPRSNPHDPTQRQLIAQLLANGPEAVASLARASAQQEEPIEVRPLAADPLTIEPIRIDPIEDNPAPTGGLN